MTFVVDHELVERAFVCIHCVLNALDDVLHSIDDLRRHLHCIAVNSAAI